MARRRTRKLARRKKVFWWVIAGGVTSGFAAILLWPRLKALMINPVVTAGQPTITQNAVAGLLGSI